MYTTQLFLSTRSILSSAIYLRELKGLLLSIKKPVRQSLVSKTGPAKKPSLLPSCKLITGIPLISITLTICAGHLLISIEYYISIRNSSNLIQKNICKFFVDGYQKTENGSWQTSADNVEYFKKRKEPPQCCR